MNETTATQPGGFTGVIEALLYARNAIVAWVVSGDTLAPLIGTLLSIILVFTGFYGLAMGWRGGVRQGVSAAVKTPLLFLLSLAVCFPVLFVVNVLLGARVNFAQTASLLLFALALNAILLASFAPIAGFFGLASDYHFMKILHVAVFAVCAAYSMYVLYEALTLMAGQNAGYPARALHIFQIWIVVYGFVGAQMAWMLRPFIGEPGLPFEILRRDRDRMNFYTAVWHSARSLADAGKKPEAAQPNQPA